MVNPFNDVNWHPDDAARRRFGRSLVIGFPIIGVVLWVVLRTTTGEWTSWAWWLAGIGTATGLVCWTVPVMAWPVYLLWHAVGASIGIVVSNLLLITTWLITILPIGMIMRALRRDPMKRTIDRKATTYWRSTENPSAPERYFRQF